MLLYVMILPSSEQCKSYCAVLDLYFEAYYYAAVGSRLSPQSSQKESVPRWLTYPTRLKVHAFVRLLWGFCVSLFLSMGGLRLSPVTFARKQKVRIRT